MLALVIVMLLLGVAVGLLAGAVRGFREAWKKEPCYAGGMDHRRRDVMASPF